jgi:acetylornithine deacetylase/succinyl-diaminopimelate desuccinylase-like protein
MKTVLPRDAAAQLDFRLVEDQDLERLFAGVRDHLNAGGFGDVELTRIAAALPVRTALDDPLVARVTSIAERSHGAPVKILPSSPPTQPVLAPLERHVGVTGLAAPDNSPDQGSAIHAPNEHIRLEELVLAGRFFRAALSELHEGAAD